MSLQNMAMSAFCLVLLSGASLAAGDVPEANRWYQSSDEEIYRVTLQPESGPPVIGEMQRWIITVHAPGNEPVYPARISVGGGMQGHGHGLPTQPQVVAYGGDGAYLVDGVRFNMAGTWRLSFFIESAHGRDRVDFDLELEF